jgi:death-on-curing protein
VKEPLWIDERDALALHDRLIAIDGGAAGLRDKASLQSALAQPRQHLAHASAPDIAGLAAS